MPTQKKYNTQLQYTPLSFWNSILKLLMLNSKSKLHTVTYIYLTNRLTNFVNRGNRDIMILIEHGSPRVNLENTCINGYTVLCCFSRKKPYKMKSGGVWQCIFKKYTKRIFTNRNSAYTHHQRSLLIWRWICTVMKQQLTNYQACLSTQPYNHNKYT